MGKLKENIRIFKEADTDNIVDYIHDQRFSISDIKYDADNRTLSIPLPSRLWDIDLPGVSKYNIFKNKHPTVMALLIFHNVNSYSIVDEAQVDAGYINTFYYKDNEIIVDCCLPVEIFINISELDIELIFTDNIVT